MAIKILLVEDDTNLGFIISDQLQDEGYEVVLASDGMEGFQQFNKVDFHLCILDVMLPKKDGFTLAADIRKIDKKIPILFLTAKTMTEDKIKGFNVGGDDYLTKPFNADELSVRVKALLKRVDVNVNETPDIYQLGEYVYDTQNFVLTLQGKETKLTRKEAQILKLLCKFQNQVVPRETILNAVWGKDDYFVGRSLDVFITKLRKHLAKDSSVSIENSHGIGFKLEVDG